MVDHEIPRSVLGNEGQRALNPKAWPDRELALSGEVWEHAGTICADMSASHAQAHDPPFPSTTLLPRRRRALERLGAVALQASALEATEPMKHTSSATPALGRALLDPLVLLLGAVCLLVLSDRPAARSDPPEVDYWHAGKAEISRFRLEQSRYGETREGDLIQVFVTEDFLPELQVKSERGNPTERGAVHILKLNSLRKFVTGIYDYSMMRSSFVPMETGEGPQLIKSTTSSQDWCGQRWLQVNRRADRLHVERRSYFELPADRRFSIAETWMEDELWTRIRVAPSKLPRGEVQMVPGTFDLFLDHRAFQPESAVVSRHQLEGDLDRLEVHYANIGRTLSIDFERASPHRIVAFVESQEKDGKTIDTRGTRTHQVMDDYWNHKSLADEGLRSSLGLK